MAKKKDRGVKTDIYHFKVAAIEGEFLKTRL
jgi:hypothetical protein